MICPGCMRPVLVAIVGGQTIIADLYEWQPRSRCFPCAGAQATSKNGKVHCSRCGGDGYIGSKRPSGPMLAIDVAWSDEGNIRLITANTPRRRGEALHALHRC
jgi:hypothetical protein